MLSGRRSIASFSSHLAALSRGGSPGRVVSRSPVIGLAVLATALCCAGCFLGSDRIFGSQRLGIELLDGRPAVLLYSCPGQPVTTLAIKKHNIHDMNDEVLWQVERTSPSRRVLVSQRHSVDRDRFLSMNRKNC